MRGLLLAALLLAAALAQAAEPGARRVVALAPSLSEIMLELDAAERLVGVLDGGPRPPALAHLPSLGRHGQLNLEVLLGLQPDLILLWPDSVGPVMQARLRGLGIRLLETQPHSLVELAEQLATIGAAVGHAEQGERLAARMRAGIAELAARHRRAEPLRVFYQVWGRPMYTLGGRQIVSDALRLCGARNVFEDLSLPAPQVSVESVLARDPAVILVGEPGQAHAWRDWPQLTAVQRGQVWEVPDEGIERPSFQMLAATAKLCELLDRAR
ncbi:cobalamin-binding protein [Pseudomonas stutzeri]|nr:cobalamin-binding protein [Stutzerimonas stutzeri]